MQVSFHLPPMSSCGTHSLFPACVNEGSSRVRHQPEDKPFQDKCNSLRFSQEHASEVQGNTEVHERMQAVENNSFEDLQIYNPCIWLTS